MDTKSGFLARKIGSSSMRFLQNIPTSTSGFASGASWTGILMCVLFALLIPDVEAPAATGKNSIFADDENLLPPSLITAARQAKIENKLMVLLLSSRTDATSLRVANHFAQGDRLKLLVDQNFVFVEVPAGSDKDCEKRYGIEHYPQVLVLMPDGSEIDRLGGYRSESQLVTTLARLHMRKKGIEQSSMGMDMPSSSEYLDHLILRSSALEKRDDYAGSVRTCVDYLGELDRTPDSDGKNAGHYRRRFSMISTRLCELGKRYPPALEALRHYRDENETYIKEKSDEPRYIHNIIHINSALGERERNVILYKLLSPRNSLKALLFRDVFQDLIAAREYSLAVADYDLEGLVHGFYPRERLAHDHAGHAGEACPIDKIGQRLRDATLAAIEAFIGSGEAEPAKRLAGRALDTVNADGFREMLVAAAERSAGAKAPEFCQWLGSYREKQNGEFQPPPQTSGAIN